MQRLAAQDCHGCRNAPSMKEFMHRPWDKMNPFLQCSQPCCCIQVLHEVKQRHRASNGW